MVDELLKMYYTLFNMLRWNTTTQIIKVCSIDVYFYSNKIASNNITKLCECSFCCCWHSMLFKNNLRKIFKFHDKIK